MKPVVVKAPASTANLGPGFDCLGLAVNLHDTLEMSPAERGVQVEIEGEGAESLPRGARNLMVRAARRVFDSVGRAPGGLSLRVKNEIPLGSGLGSSAAAIVAGLLAANTMTKGKLSREDLLRLAHGMEGHPDNAAASLFGGLNLVSTVSGMPVARQVPIAKLKLIVALPTRFHFHATDAARAPSPSSTRRRSFQRRARSLHGGGTSRGRLQATRDGDGGSAAPTPPLAIHSRWRSGHDRGTESGCGSGGPLGCRTIPGSPCARSPRAHRARDGANPKRGGPESANLRPRRRDRGRSSPSTEGRCQLPLKRANAPRPHHQEYQSHRH